ncbi:uncharacterized protein Z519_10745 [Cladophialophora bantiana CBS 173.52]|uniref:Uncharacterized protein n=1 Tax=Cladophialophora bantiana (strain ATCC 10958 / CBS 173.52 / CDC B-1940 / NIH 8579) TaxID=1442370 RepID=A0A0D2HVU1_CLAB1|nr:uncharacterized protein Z519_10745 [Cladophialophora bantiana CBS 173.52]KIW88699.1 hypothetical protein Z519_10745 [Cladophialophora bantiana CBS 173.52]
MDKVDRHSHNVLRIIDDRKIEFGLVKDFDVNYYSPIEASEDFEVSAPLNTTQPVLAIGCLVFSEKRGGSATGRLDVHEDYLQEQ